MQRPPKIPDRNDRGPVRHRRSIQHCTRRGNRATARKARSMGGRFGLQWRSAQPTDVRGIARRWSSKCQGAFIRCPFRDRGVWSVVVRGGFVSCSIAVGAGDPASGVTCCSGD